MPLRESFDTAIAAFRSGNFDVCLAILVQHDGPEAAALRARCLIRSGRPADALEGLSELEIGPLGHRSAAELLTIKVAAAIAAGDSDLVEEALVDAKARSYGVGCVQLGAELRYYEALNLWTNGRFDEARESCIGSLEREPAIPAWLQEDVPAYPYSLGYWRARIYELLAMIAAADLDFSAQASFLMQAFDEYDRADCADAFVEAGMLSNLAVIVRDSSLENLSDYVRARFVCMRWNDSLAKFRFQILEALGWCNALGGDHLGGLRDFRASADIAPNKPLKIMAILDRAFLAGELGENFSAAEELEYATRIATEVDWDRCYGQERLVLLTLIQAVASRNVVQGRMLADLYAGLKSQPSRLVLFAGDRRTRGQECMALASVTRAEGQFDRAVFLFREAFEIWTDVGYAWRAAVAALELFSLTGEDQYLDVVARESAARPLSWIARRYASIAHGRAHQPLFA